MKLKSCGFLIYRELPLLPTHSAEVQPAATEQKTVRSFLLMKHTKRWDLPKGHVDEGESNLECALRELEEETGIRSTDIHIDPEFKFKSKYKVTYKRFGDKPIKKKLIIYLAKLINDVEIQLSEHKGYHWWAWCPPHEIQEKTIDPLLAAVAEHWSTKPQSNQTSLAPKVD